MVVITVACGTEETFLQDFLEILKDMSPSKWRRDDPDNNNNKSKYIQYGKYSIKVQCICRNKIYNDINNDINDQDNIHLFV